MLIRMTRALAAGAVFLLSVAPGAAFAASSTSAQVGWVRLAHLSPNTPPVDVYLYSFGASATRLVLDHVAYGDASPYESLAPGYYVVAMRSAGAASTTSPVISTNIDVQAGKAYTVAGLGPSSALTLQVLDDQLDAPAGRADVRVIEASLRAPEVTINAASDTLATSLRFPMVTGYTEVAPGRESVSVHATDGSTNSELDFAPNASYTLAVIDSADGLPTVLDLTDSASASVVPAGGVATGFGGTASRPDTLTLTAEWGALLLLGAGGTLYASRRLRRN
jgi:hypothetical protein